MTNWDVTVVTDSGFFKKLTLEGYVSQQDAASAALGMTGGKKVISIHPSFSAPRTITNQRKIMKNTFNLLMNKRWRCMI
jgi:hypothetical protein